MEINKPARKYRSMVLAKIIEQTSSVEKLQAETKMSLAARMDDLIASRGGSGKSDFAAAVRKKPFKNCPLVKRDTEFYTGRFG